MRSWTSNWLLAAGSILVILLLAEVACRIAGYGGLEQYRPDSELGWVLAPAQRTVTKVNHLPVFISPEGFRDDPLERPKPPRLVRIFSLGNSATFGWGVRAEQVYSQLLERTLNEDAVAAGSPIRYAIVNAGVNAYNLAQVSGLMRRVVKRYQPDGFLIAYTFNDNWNGVGHLGTEELHRVLFGVRLKNLLRKSALYNWLVEVQARRVYDRLRQWVAAPPAGMGTVRGDSVSTASINAYRGTLDSIVRLARRAKVSLAFVVLAQNGQSRGGAYQTAMLETSARERIPVVDLVSALAGMRTDSLYLLHDDVHLSPAGHRWLAERLRAGLCAAARAGAERMAIYQDGCRQRAGRPGS